MEYLAIAVVALAALVLLHLQHNKQLDQIDRLVGGFADERRKLLNRIQSPETAAFDTGETELSEEPLYIEQDDDEGYEDYRERRKAGELV